MEELKLGDYTFKGDPHQENWAEEAACRTARPDELFVRGAAQHKAAQQNCAECPVQAACLRDAMEAGIQWGVWGGLTERQRRQIVRKMGGFLNVIAEIDRQKEADRTLRIEQNTHPQEFARIESVEPVRRSFLAGIDFGPTEQQAS